MTKVVEWGYTSEVEKDLIPIEFKAIVYHDKILHDVEGNSPIRWKYLSLILAKEYHEEGQMDLIAAWNDEDYKVLFWGHWNDGVAE